MYVRAIAAAMATVFVVTMVPAQESSCRLLSELRTNYTAGGNTSFFTWYTYDTDGNRIEQDVYAGADTTGTGMSTTEYTYDTEGRLTNEILKSGTTTLGSVSYSYDGNGNLVETRTLRPNGDTRFYDSLFYDANDNLVRRDHYAADDTKTYYHALTCNAAGHTLADTLYEPDGQGGFVARQASLFTHDTDGRVTAEANWREQSGWFLISTVMMTYDNGYLASATEYEGDGSSTKMLDSLAFESDQHGNRTRESRYNDERTLVHTVDYTWDCPVRSVARTTESPRPELSARARSGVLTILGAEAPVHVSLYDMGGRLVERLRHAPRGGDMTITAPAGGGYLARIRTGSRERTLVVGLVN